MRHGGPMQKVISEWFDSTLHFTILYGAILKNASLHLFDFLLERANASFETTFTLKLLTVDNTQKFKFAGTALIAKLLAV